MTQILDVLGLDSSGDVVRAFALALPVLVLLTLLVLLIRGLLIRGRRRAKEKSLDAPLTVIKNRSEPSEPVAQHGPQEVVLSVRPAVAATLPSTAQRIGAPREMPAPAAKMPRTHQSLEAIEKLQTQLNIAMKSAPNSKLAPMFLDMARHHKAAGDESSYMAALRSAAGFAAQHGPRAAHAQARLELAEAAFNSGDLIGACEQWQMARVALQDDGQKDAYAAVDKRMRDNGCPTDWVLTDF
jgi:hypothetical protein